MSTDGMDQRRGARAGSDEVIELPAEGLHAGVWDLAVDLLSVAGTDGFFRELSASWEKTLGWTREELCSRSLIEFVHPDDRDRTVAELGLLQQPGHVVRGFENRYATADGDHRWLSWNARSDRTGELIFSVATDITETRALAEARRRADERFRLAMAEAPHGMALVGLDGSWLEVNDAYAALVGYTPDELTSGLTFQDITHPDDLDTDVHHVEALIAGRIPRYSMEKRYLHRDGGIIWVSLGVSLLRDAQGEPDVFIAQVVDITPTKSRERELQRLVDGLEESQEEMHTFVGAAGHDITSPLGMIGGFLDLIAATEELSPDGRDMVARAQALGDRSIDLVRGLLRFGLAGAAKPDATDVDASLVLEEVLDTLADEIVRTGASVQTSPLPRVHADRAAVTSLLQNLVGNALKYAGEHPRIEVSGARRGDDVVVYVDDDGPGIPAGEREAVQKPFTRGSQTASHEGSGLGLATCRRIVDRLGGGLRIEVSPLGGTRVAVRLPGAYVRAD